MVKLMAHQAELVERLRRQPRYAAFWEPGAGKTHGVLAAVSDAKARGYMGRTLVIAPKSILWSAWAGDGGHWPSLAVQVCWGDAPAKRKKLIAKPADIYVINPASFKRHIEDFRAAGVTRLVVDESSCLKDPDSQISKTCYEFSRHCDSVILLSGTPAPNNETEYFGQVRCVDPAVFGSSFWRFAYRYFVPQKRIIKDIERIIGWKPNAQTRSEFTAKLESVSWTLRTRDCIDLPEETDAIREVFLSPEETRVYVALMEELAVEFEGEEPTFTTINARTMKLRQVTGGHLYNNGQVRSIGTAKLDALEELLEELGEQQLVIWAEFTAEIDMLVSYLRTRPGGVAKIDGSVDAHERAHHISDFQAGQLRYLVCHPQAAGHGITLTAAHYDCFYSLSFSAELHEQARKRIHRNGQRWPVTHYYLVARQSIDEKVLAVLRRKLTAAEAMKELLSGLGRLNGKLNDSRYQTIPA